MEPSLSKELHPPAPAAGDAERLAIHVERSTTPDGRMLLLYTFDQDASDE